MAAGALSSHGQHNLEQALAHFVIYVTVHQLSMNDRRPLKFTHKFSKNVLLGRAFSLSQSGGLSGRPMFRHDAPGLQMASRAQAVHLPLLEMGKDHTLTMKWCVNQGRNFHAREPLPPGPQQPARRARRETRHHDGGGSQGESA